MEESILALKERNKRVESDKAWEISKTRRILIAIMTYFIIVIFLYIIDISRPWLNALVPTIGFLLSTLTLSIFKKTWIKKIYKK